MIVTGSGTGAQPPVEWLALAILAQAPPWIEELDARVARIRTALERGRWDEAEAETRSLRSAVEAGAATWSEMLEDSRKRHLLSDLVTRVRELSGVVEARARDASLHAAGTCDALLDAIRGGGSSGR